MSEDKKSDERARNFWFVFYPESAPQNWREIIESWHCEAYVSPLHNRDLNGDNTFKKEHLHVVVSFGGKKSLSQIQKMSDDLSGVKLQSKINIVKDKRVAIRYLIHRDNPEKAQYEIGEILEFGNADCLQFFLEDKDEDRTIAEMMNWCRVNECFSFAQFANFCAENKIEWFRILHSKKSYFFDKFIKSLSFEQKSKF